MAFGRRWSAADIDRAKNKAPQSENKKIKNATKVTLDGVQFASKLELYCYNMLKASEIRFEFQVPIVLQEKFRFEGEAIREIKMIIDFYLPDNDMYIDTKGFQTPDSKLKFKMLKHKIHKEGSDLGVELPKNKKEVDALVNRLLFGNRVNP